jgi:hypothetical protein
MRMESQGAAAAAVQPPAGLSWKRFANHTHTSDYGPDAFMVTILQRIMGAAGEGADCVSVTEHWVTAGCSDPNFKPYHGCYPMSGEEWGRTDGVHPQGEMNLLNLSSGPAIGGQDPAAVVGEALQRGATCVINHPKAPSYEWTWETIPAGVHGIEVWTGVLFAAGTLDAVAWWQGHLVQGRRLFAVGGSDIHLNVPMSLLPCNYVLARSSEPDAIQAGLEAGAVTISGSPRAARCFLWLDADGDGVFETPQGGDLGAAQRRTVRFRVEVFGGQGLTMAIITGAGDAATLTVGAGDPWHADFTAAPDASTRDMVRAELRGRDTMPPLISLCNPIYVNFAPGYPAGNGIP